MTAEKIAAVRGLKTAETCIRIMLARLRKRAYYHPEDTELVYLIHEDENALRVIIDLERIFRDSVDELHTEPIEELEEFSRRINRGNYD